MDFNEVAQNLDLNALKSEYKELAEIIGLESLISLCDYYGGTKIYVPTLKTLVVKDTKKLMANEFDGTNMIKLMRKGCR